MEDKFVGREVLNSENCAKIAQGGTQVSSCYYILHELSSRKVILAAEYALHKQEALKSAKKLQHI